MSASASPVVALGAWCDLHVPPPGGATPGGVHFRVSEFAVLADGRRVTIRDDLGFSSWSRVLDESGHVHAVDPWPLTRESLEADVRNVVLPDEDAEALQDAHPYGWLSELLARQGIHASAEHLRSVPYSIEFSEHLERRLSEGGPPSDGG